MLTEHQKTYFAAANTSNGFISYFDSIFDPNTLKEIIIIKGGPGTGKSGLMRRVAEEAEKKGYSVERFLCSSDPSSLDGIIIKEKGLAILDGTNPHTVDPKYPGAVETILNTGLFWNKTKLCENKEKIIPLIQEKNRYYKRAYQFLKAAGEIAREIEVIGTIALDREKMLSCIDRIGKRIFKKSEVPSDSIRQVSAIGSEGEIALDSFASSSDDIYVIEDHCLSAYSFLIELYRKAITEKQAVVRSYSCIIPERINSLWFPSLRCTFTIGEKNYDTEDKTKTYHYVNMRRFVSAEAYKDNKQKLKFGGKCMDMLMSGASDAFSQAAYSHKALEKIYISAMDFDRFGKMSEELINELI